MATITRGEAYSILELPIGADLDAIRTSYKRLAQKCHPEKNPKSYDAVQKFQRINQAYAALNQANGTTKLTSLEEMYAQYQQVMYPKHRHAMLDDDYDSSGDPDSCTTSDSENDPMSSVFSYFGSSANRRKQQQDHGGVDLDNDVPLTDEQREQLANELITEEEKKKRQLEKRRLKKKQRREKKRLEKQSVEPAKPESAKKTEKLKEQMSTAKVKKEKIDDAQQQQHDYLETQDDDSTAFSDSSRKNLETAARLKNEGNHSSPVKNKEHGAPDEVDPVIIRSRQFAIQGNNMACNGQYLVAIEYFTKAIQLDGSDYRFYGNRSYCYERLDQFDKALKDANKAVSLAPDWPKGYFRKGRALLGLKNYSAAEEAFMQVLKLDSKCEDARQELNRVRTCQLMEMGFSEVQAQNAVRQFDSVQQALDSLLAGLVSENPALGDVYFSDEDDVVPAQQQQQQQRPAGLPAQQPTQSKPVAAVPVPAPAKQPASNSIKPAQSLPAVPAAKNSHKKKEPLPPIPQHHYEEAARQIKQSRAAAPVVQVDSFKMDPNNPEGLTSLWVGNVQPTVTQEVLYEMFSKYGMLQSVRILPEKFCAFVNYVDKDCAGRAMHGLQGNMCAGSPLLIKFPDNPVTANSGSSLPEKPVKSSAEPVKTVVPVQTLSKAPAPVNATSAVVNTKLRGPVNGDECYFWRTTGCQFTTGCRYRHVPENKGVDKKPWQRVAK